MAKRKALNKDVDGLTGADVKANFQPVTMSVLEEYADEDSIARGQSYFRDGYVTGAALQGNILRARSMGQSGGPYNMQVTLVPLDQPAGAPLGNFKCNCPRGDFCKHLVALMLTWMRAPERVEVRTDIAALLQDKSREELLAVIVGLLKKQPDLDRAIENIVLATTPRKRTPGTANKLTISPNKIKRQVSSAFPSDYDSEYEWGHVDVAEPMEEMLEAARGYAGAGQWANAQLIYSTVAEEIIDHYEELEDEGEISEVVKECALGLVECLDAQAGLDPSDRLSPEMRLNIFRTLIDARQFEHDYGGWDGVEDIAEVIARTSTPGERAEIEGWLRVEISEASDGPYSYTRGNLVEFMLMLKEKDGLTDEQRLQEYRSAGMIATLAGQLEKMGRVADALAELRRAGMYKQMVEVLVEHDRVDEALDIARKRLTTPGESINFAELLIRKDEAHRPQAVRLIEDLLWEDKDASNTETYLQWLEERYVEMGSAGQALDMAEQRFKIRPGERTYEAVKRAALMPGHTGEIWPGIRADLINKLEVKKEWAALVSIYLQEGAIPEAVDAYWTLERAKRPERSVYSGTSSYYVYSGLPRIGEPVARAAEQDYPDKARQIYARMAELFIDFRGRENYQQAVKYLLKVKELYEREGKAEEWASHIADVRAVNKSLRALKEELDRLAL